MDNTEPDQSYAYVILVTSFFGHFIVYGSSYSMGVFYNEFRDAFYDAKTSVALIASIHTAVLFVTGPVSSALTNRFGPRVVCFLGGVCSGCAFAISMFAQNVYTLYVTFGALSGFGLGLSYIPVITILPEYFLKRRSLAIGIASSGGGAANFAVPPIAQLLINTFGWRGTCLLLGGAAFHLCVLGLLLWPSNTNSMDQFGVDHLESKPEVKYHDDRQVRCVAVNVENSRLAALKYKGSLDSLVNPALQKRKAKFDISGSIISLHSIGKSNSNMAINMTKVSGLGIGDDTKEGMTSHQTRNLMNVGVFKNGSFLLLCGNNLCIMFGVIMVYVHLPAHAVTAGLSSSQGSLLLSFVGIGSIAGRILFGILAGVSCFSDTCLYSVVFFVNGVVTALTAMTTDFIGLTCISFLFGAFYGVMCALLPQITIKILDISLLVSGYGYLLFFEAVGSLSGPPIAEFLFNQTGDYISSFFLAGAMLFISSLLMIYPWLKIRKSDYANENT